MTCDFQPSPSVCGFVCSVCGHESPEVIERECTGPVVEAQAVTTKRGCCGGGLSVQDLQIRKADIQKRQAERIEKLRTRSDKP